MGAAINLAMTVTATDMASRIVERIAGRIKSIASVSEDAKKRIGAGFKDFRTGSYWAGGGIGMAMAMRPGIQAAANVQEAMNRVKMNIVSGAKGPEELARQLEAVKKSAMGIAQNMPFTAKDIIGIENALLKAGLALDSVTGGAAQATANMAVLGEMDPSQAADAMANIGAVFNLAGEQYSALSDWMVRVDDVTATSIPKIVYGLQIAGSQAKQFGVSAEEVVTALGALAPLGDMAGTSLSRFLSGTVGASDSDKNMMKSLGLDFFEGGKFVGMESAIERVRTVMASTTDEQKRALIMSKLFGEQGQRAAQIFTNSEKSYSAVADQASRAAGATEKMKIWAEGANASMTKLSGTISTTMAQAFEPTLGVVTKIADKINEFSGSKAGTVVANSIPYAMGALSLGAMAFGTYKMARGAGGILGGIMGRGSSLAGGLTTGAAISAATGGAVQQVFVVNWPAGGVGGIQTSKIDGPATALQSLIGTKMAAVLAGTSTAAVTAAAAIAGVVAALAGLTVATVAGVEGAKKKANINSLKDKLEAEGLLDGEMGYYLKMGKLPKQFSDKSVDEIVKELRVLAGRDPNIAVNVEVDGDKKKPKKTTVRRGSWQMGAKGWYKPIVEGE